MSNSAFPNAQNQAAGAIPVYTVAAPSGSSALPTAIYGGQATATGTAAALGSQALQNGVTIQALSTNSGMVYVGPASVTTATGYPLAAGQAVAYNLANIADVYIVGTGSVAWTGN